MRRLDRASRIGLGILVLLTVLIYAQTLFFEFVVYDDQVFVFSAGTREWWHQSLRIMLTTPHIGYPIPLVVALYATLIEFWTLRFRST